MYIESVPNRNSPPPCSCASPSATPARSRKRTLANLSKWPPTLIEGLRVLLKGGAAVSRLDDAFDIVRSKPHGHVAAALGTLRKLRLERVIAGADSPERRRVLAMIVARVLEPGSKLATARSLAADTAHDSLAETLALEDCDEDDLYAAMDWLLERQDAIERRLARRHLQDGALVLYDLTSVWLEGRHCPLGKRGHSRDGKRGKLQIEFGLLCDAEGRPVAVEVFDGNTADPATVGAQVDKLRRRFGFSRVVLVGDRGMLTEARIREDVRPAGLDWISALRGPAVRSLVESGAVQLSLFDETDLVEIRSDAYPGERLMVCRNPLLAEERARKREELLRATEALLDPIVAAARREQAAPEGRGQDRRAGGQGRRQIQDGQALRVGYRRGRVRLSAKARVHRRGGGAGRLVRRAHQPARERTRRRERRARVQAPERGRARLPKLEDRGPEGAARVPPNRRPGPRTCVPVHAGLLRGMAYARSGSSRCCSTTTTRPQPRRRALPSWRRRRSPKPPRKRPAANAPPTVCRCTASAPCSATWRRSPGTGSSPECPAPCRSKSSPGPPRYSAKLSSSWACVHRTYPVTIARFFLFTLKNNRLDRLTPRSSG